MKNTKTQRLSMIRLLILAVTLTALVRATGASAATIFASGTLGPTGIPMADLRNGNVPGTNIKDVVFAGVRFELTQQVITSQIGGHFVAPLGGTFFGVIVALDDANDFPDSGDLSTPDVLGNTLLSFPVPSNEVFGDLNLSLEPGWYALVFGSGLFGATTNGATVRNGIDIADPTYIAFQPGSAFGWNDITSFAPNHRFVVTGLAIPEGSSISLASLASIILLFRR